MGKHAYDPPVFSPPASIMGSEPPVARGLRPFALPHPKRLSTSPDSPAGLAHNTLRPGSLPLRRPWPIGVGRSPIHEGVGVSFGALALSDALIHPSAWKKNSRKFAVANGSSTYRQALENRLCSTPLGSKRGNLVAVVAPLCIKGLRLVTVQLPEKSWPTGPGLNRTSPLRSSRNDNTRWTYYGTL